MNKNDRTGEIRTMKNGMKCTIIRYGTKRDIDVQFEDSYTSYNVEYGNFKKGTIKNPYVTKVYGVGILDKEADKEIYRRWMGMLKRCYSKNELKSVQLMWSVVFVKSGYYIAISKNGTRKTTMKLRMK